MLCLRRRVRLEDKALSTHPRRRPCRTCYYKATERQEREAETVDRIPARWRSDCPPRSALHDLRRTLTSRMKRHVSPVFPSIMIVDYESQRRSPIPPTEPAERDCNSVKPPSVYELCQRLVILIPIESDAEFPRERLVPLANFSFKVDSSIVRAKGLVKTTRLCVQHDVAIFITQRLYLINGVGSTFGPVSPLRCWVVVCHMYDCFPLYMLHASSPIYPIILRSNQKCDQHTGIHLSNVNSTETRCVTRVHLLIGIVVRVWVIWKCLSGVVRVKIE